MSMWQCTVGLGLAWLAFSQAFIVPQKAMRSKAHVQVYQHQHPHPYQQQQQQHYYHHTSPLHALQQSRSQELEEKNAMLLAKVIEGGPAKIPGNARELLEVMDAHFLEYVQTKLQNAKTDADRELYEMVMNEIFLATQASMERANACLKDILSAGELKKMEGKLKAYLRQGEINNHFLLILAMNIQGAQEAKEDMAEKVLTHLHSVILSERDKVVSPPLRLMRMLLRTDCQGARKEMLRQKVVFPNPTRTPEESGWGLAEVQPHELLSAIHELLAQFENLEEKDLAGDMASRCRSIRSEFMDVLSENSAV